MFVWKTTHRLDVHENAKPILLLFPSVTKREVTDSDHDSNVKRSIVKNKIVIKVTLRARDEEGKEVNKKRERDAEKMAIIIIIIRSYRMNEKNESLA